VSVLPVGQGASGSYQTGDALTLARELPDDHIDCIVTSPPYWGLRSYLADDDPAKAQEMGAETTLAEYVKRLVVLFSELRRALKPEGTCWLNLGDSYWGGGGGNYGNGKSVRSQGGQQVANVRNRESKDGLKSKDLCLVPFRVALALQADGWYLRSHIIWAKPNPMPESVKDRPTSSHEAVFLLTKNARYSYDAEAVKEPSAHQHRAKDTPGTRASQPSGAINGRRDSSGGVGYGEGGRNIRNVWTIATKPYIGSHYATMPPKLVEPCIKAGCPVGGLVLDPFGGSGTVAQVAQDLGRRWLMFDLDKRNVALIKKRTAQGSLMGLMSPQMTGHTATSGQGAT
jgi:DNA modification methylase